MLFHSRPLKGVVTHSLDHSIIYLFVRDGIPSVADYNSTLMGVVVVVVVVAIFTMG